MYFAYHNADLPIRDDLFAAHQSFWQRLAKPGAWFDGRHRVAIAAESRNAWDCSFCTARKNALSPHALEARHDRVSNLPETALDAVHRIVTDQQRISRKWIEDNAKKDLSEAAYVELLGLVVAVISIDEFHRTLGLPLEELPAPEPGEPSGYLPAGAERGTGFVPMLPADGPLGENQDLWQPGFTANVIRALSFVPDAVRDWKNLAAAQYLSIEGMANMVGQDDRAINRMQMEVLAARVSAMNECFY